MTLRDKYLAFIARGMKPPDHLGWDDEKGCFGVCVVADIAPDEDGIQPVLRLCDVPDAVAESVIAAHVMEWFTGENFGRNEDGESLGGKHGDLSLRIDLDDKRPCKPYKRWAASAMFGRDNDFKLHFGDTVLEAVLAATVNLEPREAA